MNNFFEIAASAAECGIIVSFCDRFLGFRKEGTRWMISAVFFVLIFMQNILFSQMEGFENFSVGLLMLMIFCYAVFFLKGRVYEKILISILPPISVLLINQFLITIFCTMSESPLSESIRPGGRLRLPILFFSKVVFFVICEILIRLRKHGQYSLSRFQWIVQLLCFFNTFLIAITLWNISKEFIEMREKFIPVYILVAVLNVLMYILLNKMQYDSAEKEKLRLSEISLASQEKFIEEAREHYAEMITLRHDMRHYLTTAAKLISDGKTEEAKSYIEKLAAEKVSSFAVGVDTGNVVIDAVINNRLADCARDNIEVKCLIDSRFEGISETDISILLSNALDNAISGCAGVSAPRIELTIGTRMAFTYIIVRNSIPSSVLSGNPKLVTSKGDRTIHGFGIGSMRRIAEKYGGSVEFREEKDSFIAEIWLKKL